MHVTGHLFYNPVQTRQKRRKLLRRVLDVCEDIYKHCEEKVYPETHRVRAGTNRYIADA